MCVIFLTFFPVVLTTVLVYTLLPPITRYIAPSDPQFSYPYIYETFPGSLFAFVVSGKMRLTDTCRLVDVVVSDCSAYLHSAHLASCGTYIKERDGQNLSLA